jgi:hypothetical protein
LFSKRKGPCRDFPYSQRRKTVTHALHDLGGCRAKKRIANKKELGDGGIEVVKEVEADGTAKKFSACDCRNDCPGAEADGRDPAVVAPS